MKAQAVAMVSADSASRLLRSAPSAPLHSKPARSPPGEYPWPRSHPAPQTSLILLDRPVPHARDGWPAIITPASARYSSVPTFHASGRRDVPTIQRIRAEEIGQHPAQHRPHGAAAGPGTAVEPVATVPGAAVAAGGGRVHRPMNGAWHRAATGCYHFGWRAVRPNSGISIKASRPSGRAAHAQPKPVMARKRVSLLHVPTAAEIFTRPGGAARCWRLLRQASWQPSLCHPGRSGVLRRGRGWQVIRAKAVGQLPCRHVDPGGLSPRLRPIDLDSDRITLPIRLPPVRGPAASGAQDRGLPAPLFDLYAWRGGAQSWRRRVQCRAGAGFSWHPSKAAEVAGSFWAPLTDFATPNKAVDLVLKAAITPFAPHGRPDATQCISPTSNCRTRTSSCAEHAPVLARPSAGLLDHSAVQAAIPAHYRWFQAHPVPGLRPRCRNGRCRNYAAASPPPIPSPAAVSCSCRNRLQWRRTLRPAQRPAGRHLGRPAGAASVGGLGETDAEYFSRPGKSRRTARLFQDPTPESRYSKS